MERFGEYIRKLRVEKGLNQTQLAAKIGLDSGGLSKIETGKKDLKEDKISLLAEVFEVSIEEIKTQYFSEKFAKDCFKYKCPETVFQLAEQKVKYIKNINTKQAQIKF
ncbi:MAG: helix-turn-helix transcriptional regulator [Bacteroidota bacterium]|nr:helix-turn-helix transcriptional regulator [Bacteroidota bacterium]